MRVGLDLLTHKLLSFLHFWMALYLLSTFFPITFLFSRVELITPFLSWWWIISTPRSSHLHSDLLFSSCHQIRQSALWFISNVCFLAKVHPLIRLLHFHYHFCQLTFLKGQFMWRSGYLFKEVTMHIRIHEATEIPTKRKWAQWSSFNRWVWMLKWSLYVLLVQRQFGANFPKCKLVHINPNPPPSHSV